MRLRKASFILRLHAVKVMPRKCSVGFCKSNYDSTMEKIRVYSFPTDEEEKQKWLNVLPNRIEKVTRYIGICANHWPENSPMIQVTRYARPSDPPSIFPSCPQSVLRSKPATSRQIEDRRVSSSRGEDYETNGTNS